MSLIGAFRFLRRNSISECCDWFLRLAVNRKLGGGLSLATPPQQTKNTHAQDGCTRTHAQEDTYTTKHKKQMCEEIVYAFLAHVDRFGANSQM
jgi:hypothetical protein